MKETISKSLFLNAAVCPTLGWRLRADEALEGVAPTLAQKFRMEQGAEIGRLARGLFPEGVIITTGNLAEAAAETAKLVRAGGPAVLFEATFVVDEYAAKADVLRRIGDGWHLVEVKSNINLKPELIDDLAYTLMVLIPPTFELTAIQDRTRQAVVTGQPWIGPNLKQSLSAVQWPAYYLDFETVMTARPLYPDIAPYTQIPTQYSIHKCSSVGNVDSHSEYLADPTRDSRRELAEQLITDLEGEGSIISYSNFEKTRINGLTALFPDLAGDLGKLVQRIFNLEAVIRDNYYHPSFYGKTSVKATLPALVPGMSYAALNIGDGDSAMATFAYMALGRYTDEAVESLRQDLLAYCSQDTLAMVKLHERLHQA